MSLRMKELAGHDTSKRFFAKDVTFVYRMMEPSQDGHGRLGSYTGADQVIPLSLLHASTRSLTPESDRMKRRTEPLASCAAWGSSKGPGTFWVRCHVTP